MSHEPDEKDILENWLSVKRGSKVTIIHPKRGVKRKLVDMAAENAIMAAQRENQRQLEDDTESAEDLSDLREVLGMEKTPHRIETYDISNTQGIESVGSMVVFEGGVPAKSQYRRFRIRTGDTPDDYRMMHEVILRRLVQSASGDPKFEVLPDLIVIDGGKGQLHSALQAMADAGRSLPIISLAKRLEEVYTPASTHPILLPRTSRALRLLQRTRDEAHRFALSYHQKLRDKAAKKSILDGVPGIGDARRKALVRKFGSVMGVKQASIEELTAVPGMTKSTAQAVYDALHTDE